MNDKMKVLQWKSIADEICLTHPVLKWQEIAAIVWNESTGDPWAENKSDPSYGLMGITMLIAKHYGGDSITVVDLYNPRANMPIGAAFLADLKTKYAKTNPITDPNVAWIAAYNEGEPNLWRGIPDPAYIAKYLDHLKELGGTPE